MRWFGSFRPGGGGVAVLSPAGRAGPRRLLAIAGGFLAVAGVVSVVVVTGGSDLPTPSRDAPQRPVDPLPGGIHSTPAQDAVARLAQEAGARQAVAAGTGYTPPMAPSVRVREMPPGVELPAPAAPVDPAAVASPPPRRFAAPPAPPPVIPAAWRAPERAAGAPPPIERVQAPVAQPPDPVLEAYRRQINELFHQWGGRAPRTDIIEIPTPRREPVAAERAERADTGAPPNAPTPRPAAVAQTLPPDARPPDGQAVLVPAGRGFYARSVLAVASDAPGPVILEVTSGPIAGGRLLGTFTRDDERLIIRLSSLAWNGQTIGVDGVAVAPDTMEASVASDVDQLYVRRFLLPAAAAFVQGLGQAIATTTRVTGVVGPFGSVGFAQNLSIEQQLGIAAGAAAARIGQTLNQETPRGPRVTLDVNSTVGVVFLTNVVGRLR